MKKLFLLTGLFLVTMGANAQTDTTDQGVVINGVTWATRNVDLLGTFAPTPESPGMFYQWNRNVAWSATVPGMGEPMPNWDNTVPSGTEWEKVNDPCPMGWRVPNSDDFNKLLDTEKVSNEWALQNSIEGRKFIDLVTDKTLFLPAVGGRNHSDGTNWGVSAGGGYWSSAQDDDANAWILAFIYNSGYAYLNNCDRGYGNSVRCVKDDTAAIGDILSDGRIITGYYSLMGIPLQSEPVSGVYIVLYDNGVAEKAVTR